MERPSLPATFSSRAARLTAGPMQVKYRRGQLVTFEDAQLRKPNKRQEKPSFGWGRRPRLLWCVVGGRLNRNRARLRFFMRANRWSESFPDFLERHIERRDGEYDGD